MNRPPIYPWQQGAWQHIASLIERDRLPHGIMLAGPAEIGKADFASALAQRLLCHAPEEGSPCRRCKSCQLFDARSHPDFFMLAPEEDGKAIKVDQVRHSKEFANRTASVAQGRVIVVNPADAMNLNAANAFLKILEEPGEGVVIVMVAHQLLRILPTIRSRCQILSMPLADEKIVGPWLREKYADLDLELILALSGGRPLRAKRFLETDLKDQLQRFQEVVDQIASGKMSPIEGAQFCQVLHKELAIEWFQYRVYAQIQDCAGGEFASSSIFFGFLDRLNLVKRRLLSSANPNLQLLWEELLMDWKSVIDFRPVPGGLKGK